MQKKRSFLPIFILFFVLSLLFIFLSSRKLLPGQNLFEDLFFPVQAGLFKIVTLPGNLFKNTDLINLQQENLVLNQKLSEMNSIEQDNKALHDQFATTDITSNNLLPATIIGDPQFVPGVNAPETLIINKGKKEGIRIGQAVIYQKNVVGQVTNITDHASLVTVITNKTVSLTVKTSETNSQGVLAGQGNGQMAIGSVVLSDQLKVGDMVVTSGSEDLSGNGFPPGFIIGKIVSIDKNPSSLYQSASVKSLLQIEKLSTVFVMTGH